MSKENEAIVRRHIKEFWNEGKLDIAGEIHASDYVFHDSTSPDLRGSAAYNEFAAMYRTAFPDIHFTIEDLFATGDRVAQRWSCVATHRGELMGIPPTGKKVNTTGIDIYRLANGKIVEEWVNWSTLSMLQQLGVVPPMG